MPWLQTHKLNKLASEIELAGLVTDVHARVLNAAELSKARPLCPRWLWSFLGLRFWFLHET